MRFLIICLAFIFMLSNAYSGVDEAAINRDFQHWLKSEIWPKAKAQGISQQTFEAALGTIRANLKFPDLVIPGEKPKPVKQHQAEFGRPADYFKSMPAFARELEKQRQAQQKTIYALWEHHHDSASSMAVAIWGKESAFGRAKIPYNAFEVLATKAYLSTRKDMFEKELLAALQIVEEGHTNVDMMKSSWAGALGQPQFMPTSYLKFAVDFDGDGRADIWHSTPDTLASISNFLRQKGWNSQRWGFEVILPPTVSCTLEGPDQGQSLEQWMALGTKPVILSDIKEINKDKLYLLMPAGRYGPAFLVSDNFYVLKEYNMSDLYALYVGYANTHGKTPFKTPWAETDTLLRSDVETMQKRLQKQGYDIGKADGLAGFKTRRSIGLWQEKNGEKATCFPSRKLITTIR